MNRYKNKSKLKRSIAVVAKPKARAKSRPRSGSTRGGRPPRLLYVGSRGFVRAVRQSSGRRVWETSLPETGYELVSLLPGDDLVFAGSRGKLFGLDARTGAIRWENQLRGLKYGHMLLATEPEAPYLFVGIYGHVVAISKKTGRTKWKTSLPNTGYEIVSLVCEAGGVFAGSRGILFGLDPRNGEIEWRNGLKGLGYQHLTLAGSRQASTDGSVLIEQTAADERAAAAANPH